jgi:hypothetical protein
MAHEAGHRASGSMAEREMRGDLVGADGGLCEGGDLR